MIRRRVLRARGSRHRPASFVPLTCCRIQECRMAAGFLIEPQANEAVDNGIA